MDKVANPVGWFEIYVSDMTRARDFYTAVFGRELTALPEIGEEGEMYAFSWVEGGSGAAGALVRHPMNGPGKGGTMVYFNCEDAANEAERAVEAGGRVIQPKMAIGQYGHIALVQDTEGNIIGLHSMQ
ncbi:MAG: VOC family protein [Candidatus Accumulibacter meliphilus]|jgi:predicted enzyme related to lactoylglutathione lyase|uniref:VOC family protein n=1 Tax=Candidatus Accumulibacter meliphilus TaxID=2211374 RepID=UPI002FC3B116